MSGAAWADVARVKAKANPRAGINDLHMSLLRLSAIFLRPHMMVGEPPSPTIEDSTGCRIADRWRRSYNFANIAIMAVPIGMEVVLRSQSRRPPHGVPLHPPRAPADTGCGRWTITIAMQHLLEEQMHRRNHIGHVITLAPKRPPRSLSRHEHDQRCCRWSECYRKRGHSLQQHRRSRWRE
jgi:hypothetical protein